MLRLIGIILFLNITCLLHAQQVDSIPYSTRWHIPELLQWEADNDPSAAFNRSSSPLRERFINKVYQANDHAHPNEAKVNCLSIFGTTGGIPAQGKADSSIYAFTYWEYCDLLVFWGGSANEGIILGPTAGVIDAAHRHGVPVYGTVFFPPIVYGGDRQWVYDFVQKKDGAYIVADKLIEVAEYYGFDGWFINQESGNTGEVDPDSSLAAEMRNLMVYFQANSTLGLEWYDAMKEDACVQWQHEVNEHNDMFFQYGDTLVSDYMFLDFRSTKAHLKRSSENIAALGRDRYDVFSGIDVQSNGYETKPGYRYPDGANFDVIFPEGQAHSSSLAFYVPSWTYHSSKSMAAFYQKESRFWVGEHGDPANTQTEHNWKGVAHYVPARSSINSIPFVTSFSTGQGKRYFRNGIDITYPEWDRGWSNLSRQDVQPTWKWNFATDSESEASISRESLNVGYDFSDAYCGGNSLRVSGKMEHESRLNLYSCDLQLDDESQLVIAYKRKEVDRTKLSVVLTFSDGRDIEVPIEGSLVAEGWITDTISLTSFIDLLSFQGEVLSIIGLGFELEETGRVDLNVGSLGIIRKGAAKVQPPSDLRVGSFVQEKEALTSYVKLHWKESDSDVLYYNVYGKQKGGSMVYLGTTTSTSYCISDLRMPGDNFESVLLEAISTDMSRSDCLEVCF